MSKIRTATLAAALSLFALASGVTAAAAHDLTPDQLSSVRFDQQLGQSVPLDLVFRDEYGQPVTLASLLNQRPVILSLNYFHCRYLCPIEEDGLISGLNGLSLTLGQDFNLLTVSIDPREAPSDAMLIKARGLRGYDRPLAAASWHVLTGDQTAIDQLTSAVGFQYIYDPEEDDYAHPAGVVVLTPTGQISRYIYGLDFSATDLRLALVEAASGRIGTLLDRALLICYHYDPLTGRYTPLALNLMKLGGAAGVLAMAGFLGWLWLGELRANTTGPRSAG